MNSAQSFVGDTIRKTDAIKIYGTVLGVGIACAVAIVTTYEATRPIIARNRERLRERAILEILPRASGVSPVAFDQVDGTLASGEHPAMSKPVFAAYDDGGQLIGFAIEAAGMGYQDKIQLLYGYSLTEQAIIGLYVLESRETPGLGDRIGSDEAFLSNFHRLDVSLTADGDAVANPIEFVPPGKKTSPWQIDGITGATVSSRAVSEILRDSTQYWIPRLSALQSQLTDSARHAKS